MFFVMAEKLESKRTLCSTNHLILSTDLTSSMLIEEEKAQSD